MSGQVAVAVRFLTRDRSLMWNTVLAFLRTTFDCLGTIFPIIRVGFAVQVPKLVHLLHKQVGIDQDRFIKYVVCPKCHSPYNFEQLVEEE